MTTLVCIILILCALAGSSFCQQESFVNGIILLNEKCERDIECIDNAYCRWQQMCVCDPNYLPSPDKTICTAAVGLLCEDDTMCRTLANGTCRQGTCGCKDDFFIDIRNNSNCIKRPIKAGDFCQSNQECQDSIDSTLCINGKCQCFSGYHFVNETKTCLQTKALYSTCSNSYQCYESDKPDAMECKNGQCVCKEGEPGCGEGSLSTAAGMLVTVLLLLQQLAQ